LFAFLGTLKGLEKSTELQGAVPKGVRVGEIDCR